MSNAKTNEVHSLISQQIKDALDMRDQLRLQQVDIDEKLDDVNRVILALERSIRTLKPFSDSVKAPQFKQDDLDTVAHDAIKAFGQV